MLPIISPASQVIGLDIIRIVQIISVNKETLRFTNTERLLLTDIVMILIQQDTYKLTSIVFDSTIGKHTWFTTKTSMKRKKSVIVHAHVIIDNQQKCKFNIYTYLVASFSLSDLEKHSSISVELSEDIVIVSGLQVCFTLT